MYWPVIDEETGAMEGTTPNTIANVLATEIYDFKGQPYSDALRKRVSDSASKNMAIIGEKGLKTTCQELETLRQKFTEISREKRRQEM